MLSLLKHNLFFSNVVYLTIAKSCFLLGLLPKKSAQFGSSLTVSRQESLLGMQREWAI